jgi:hypothetical protein
LKVTGLGPQFTIHYVHALAARKFRPLAHQALTAFISDASQSMSVDRDHCELIQQFAAFGASHELLDRNSRLGHWIGRFSTRRFVSTIGWPMTRCASRGFRSAAPEMTTATVGALLRRRRDLTHGGEWSAAMPGILAMAVPPLRSCRRLVCERADRACRS